MDFFKNFKISTKIIVLSALLAAVFLGSILSFVISDFKKILLGNILDTSLQNLEIRSRELEIIFNETVNDLLFISKYHGLKDVVNSEHGNEPHHVEEMEEVSDLFSGFIEVMHIYDSIRYISTDGKEMMRVDNILGSADIVPTEKLQYKGDRDYFVESVNLPEGSLYVSKTNLNREGFPPQIQIPYKPVLRYSLPLYDGNKESKGILVVNILVEKLFDVINIDVVNNDDISIIDQEGYYLLNPIKSKEWGAKEDLNTGENFFNDFAFLDESIFLKNKGVIESRDSLFNFRKVFVNKTDQDIFWVILKEDKKSFIFASTGYIVFKNVTLAILLYLVLFVLFFTIVKALLRPLKKLESVANKVSKGDFNQLIDIRSKDEIGVVSQAFNKMTTELKDLYQNLEEKIKEQTKELSVKVKELEDSKKAMLNVLEDVEKEKKIVSQERDKVSTIIQSIGDGVFVIDNNMKIVLFNQIAANISGFTINEVIGKKFDEILHFVSEKDGKPNDQFIKTVMGTGKIQEMTNHTLLIIKNGEKVPVADSAAPLKDEEGNIIGCVVVFRDVSKERDVDRAKTEFVSLASHQLRTPLTAINWYTEMLLSGDAGKLNKNQKEFLSEVYKGNQRMVSLVNALLNVSRIDLGTFAIELEPVNFAEVCDSVLEELKPQIELRKIVITKDYDGLLSIQADKNLVRIMFQNLISNAIKYTPENGEIYIGIKKEDLDVLIKVSDNGYGIPKDQQTKIFGKLFRADNVREKDTEGTGLGLYIVRAITENSGGKVWFESEEGKGTTFYLTIPLSGMKEKKGTKGLS